MSIGTDAIDRLVKQAVSAGAAAVVVILGPGQGAAPPAGQPASPGATVTATVTPVPATTPDRAVPLPTPDPDTPTGPDIATGRATAQPRRTTTASPPPTTDVPPSTSTPPTTPRTHRTRTTKAPATTDAGTTDAATTDAGPTDQGDTGTATDATTAAATRGWGTPTRTADFDAGTDGWQRYDGPGNNGTGRRSPDAVTIQDGLATLSGDASGTTGGMCWGAGRRYGRWEARVRAPVADPSYHPVLLLWPANDDWPAGGEIDFMELTDATRRTAQGFVHHGANNQVAQGSVATDVTRWHNWAVEWTPSSITMYLDGRQWYRTTARALQPPGPMHLCVQLDWFPTGGPVRPSTMQVDWVREYDLDGAAATGKPAGASVTGTSRAEAAG